MGESRVEVTHPMADRAHGRIAHVVPGRIRIKLGRHDLAEPFAGRLRVALMAMPEVDEVRIQPRTGSVTIYHQPAELGVDQLAQRLASQRLVTLDPTVDGPYGWQRPLSQTAAGIHETFHGVDVRLSELTNGRWDLRSVVPFALGALALRQFIADAGALGAAPWYVLAWYAFDSFWKLNEQRGVVANGDETADDE
jgi:hypothetical protein